MLVQSQPILSNEIRVAGVSPEEFKFNDFFQMGDEKTTNLSHRCVDFYDSFQQNSLHQCEIPKYVRFVGVPDSQEATIKDYLRRVQIMKEFWGLRIPIKLVGIMKDAQKIGQEGHLAVSGAPNIFLSRASNNTLQLVELQFRLSNPGEHRSSSWAISSRFFNPDEKISGPIRIFIAHN